MADMTAREDLPYLLERLKNAKADMDNVADRICAVVLELNGPGPEKAGDEDTKLAEAMGFVARAQSQVDKIDSTILLIKAKVTVLERLICWEDTPDE